MKSARPKVSFEVCGWPMVRHVAEAARAAGATRIVVVVGHGRDEVERAVAGVPGIEFAHQPVRRGTADAVKVAMRRLAKYRGTVLVLLGDVPLLRKETLRALLSSHNRSKSAATVLSATLPDGGSYGRIAATRFSNE